LDPATTGAGAQEVLVPRVRRDWPDTAERELARYVPVVGFEVVLTRCRSARAVASVTRERARRASGSPKEDRSRSFSIRSGCCAMASSSRRVSGWLVESRAVAAHDHLDGLAGGAHAGGDLGLVVALVEEQQGLAGVLALGEVVLGAAGGRVGLLPAGEVVGVLPAGVR
jgi:hypothetical protein